MQVGDQACALRLIDHKGEVEVVGRLADEVDALFGKKLQGITQPMQDAADVPPDQADRRARADHLRPTERQQIPLQCVEHRRSQRVRLWIERHGDIGLAGRDQIDRQAVLLEDLERIGKESHLMPHPRTVHRHQGHAVLRADGFDLTTLTRRRFADAGSAERRRLGGVDRQRNAVLTHRQQTTRVEHLGAGGGDLLRLVVGQLQQLSCGRRGAWIGAEHPGDIGPDLQFLRLEHRREIGR